jgi:hypothetical protein
MNEAIRTVVSVGKERLRSLLSNAPALARRIRLENPGNDYIAFHAQRYATLLAILSTYLAVPNRSVLDVGRTELTDLIGETFNVRVDSLGLERDRRTANGDHYQMDLNDAQFPDRWRKDLPKYDIVVMAEVIEHLHTSPLLTIGFIKTLMKRSAVLVIQTPNAVALHKRLIMLTGRNPFEPIRENLENPGHFREYTVTELKQYAKVSGLIVEEYFFCSYFSYRYMRRDGEGRWYLSLANLVYGVVPPSMRPGITIVLREPS